MLYDSCARNRFEGNSFVANQTPLTLVGRRTDTQFDGNYWSDNGEPDLDGDGRTDLAIDNQGDCDAGFYARPASDSRSASLPIPECSRMRTRPTNQAAMAESE